MSLSGVIYHACTSTPQPESQQEYWKFLASPIPMIWLGDQNLKKRPCPLGGRLVYPLKTNTSFTLLVSLYKIWQPFQRYNWSPAPPPKKKKKFTWPYIVPIEDGLSSVMYDLLQSAYIPNLNYLSQPTRNIWNVIQNLENEIVLVLMDHARSLEIAPIDRV